ncbi:hypothetical protein KUL17_29230 [Alteromonas sp. KUL17]|uniref:hypothetical protein n=1 Tax=Alteromonas sp. KUL17 TaxID=2480796 RepID=UPI001037525C|nr:hypothetical protein [Alteromonas sp. KUL17]TAP24555.1 hypothetical protein KUL49_14535 [Alteromonas sp. KUL17]GEA04026.1 hypothetical protein KUL17_29230 [Alteromonas sp. KUL17]
MKNLLLVHLGRSGSTVLGNLVGQYPGINWLGEVFTLEEQKGRTFKTEDEMNNYFDKLYTSEKNAFGIEVKLINILRVAPENEDSVNAVKRYLQFVNELAEKYELTPVLLLRNNILKRLVSCHAAAKSGVWHIENDGKKHKSSTLNLPVNELKDWDTGFSGSLNDVLYNGAAINLLLENYFRDNSWNVLYYEKDVENDPVSSANKLIDLSIGNEEKESINLHVKFGKTNPVGLVEKLENYNEISNLIDSEFRWMLIE